MKKDFLLDANGLRCIAEKVYKESEKKAPSLVKEADLHRLVHELQVHQIELEMQNEELLRLSVDLKASNEKYTNLYEFAPVGYFTLSRYGIIQQVNLTGARILGQERINLLERRLELSITDNNRPVFRAILEKAFESLSIETCELKLSKEDGKPIYVHLKAIASPDGDECLLAMVDITAKKLVETELIIRNQAMASSLNAIALTDLNGNFTYVNSSFLNLWGYKTDQEVLGQSGLGFWESEKNAKEIYGIVFKNGNWSGEVVARRKDSKLRDVYLSTNIVYDQDNAPICLMASCTDITDSKKAEKELLAAKEQAEAASNAQSQFLANMSHEIRTPMTGLMGMLQLLQMTELTKEQAEYIKISKTSSDALLMVINDILDYSKIEAGKLKIEKLKFNLDEFINEIEIMFKPSVLNKGLALTMLIEDNVPHKLLGDSFRLRQVLSNIIGNAIKFTQKGRIELIVRKLEERNNEVKLEWVVQDTGIGLSEEQIKDIFNSFNQADSSITRQYGGTGLGLSICKGLVELMQGEIWVESKEGEGSKFFFTCVLDDPQCRNLFFIS